MFHTDWDVQTDCQRRNHEHRNLFFDLRPLFVSKFYEIAIIKIQANQKGTKNLKVIFIEIRTALCNELLLWPGEGGWVERYL
jgi:hypothetical protein